MTLEQRVGQLENRCRKLTGVLIGTMAVTAVIVLCGAAPNADRETVRTQQLEIVDGDGKVRARLGKADEGYGVVVYDENGNFNATLTDAPLAAAIQLKKGNSGIRLQAWNEHASLIVRDPKGKPRATVFVTNDRSEFVLKDQEDETVFLAPAGE